ncbi:transposase [Streptomyces sp. CJ_13]|nr:transposase [Streptomyces sp. CJ_13]
MLESLLPAAGVSRRSGNRRRLIQWSSVAGADGFPWRDLPREYGPWQTVYGLFRRWQREGVWARILTLLQAGADAAGLITWEVNVDSTVCRAHRAYSSRANRAYLRRRGIRCTIAEPADQARNRKRRGRSVAARRTSTGRTTRPATRSSAGSAAPRHRPPRTRRDRRDQP